MSDLMDELLTELARPRPVLALMQNQWFRNPERVRDLMEGPHRRAYIHIYLFAGCLTGRRIDAAFSDLADRRTGVISFEEASPQIGGHASSRFPADLGHLRGVLDAVRPRLVLAFGRIASDALPQVWTGPSIIGPHPAARGGDVVPRLYAMAAETRAFLEAAAVAAACEVCGGRRRIVLRGDPREREIGAPCFACNADGRAEVPRA